MKDNTGTGPRATFTAARAEFDSTPAAATLWRSRSITRSFVVAVDLADGRQHDEAVAYFYDHRHASGLIPQGGAPNLGRLENVRATMAVDGALLIQTGSTIHGWTHK